MDPQLDGSHGLINGYRLDDAAVSSDSNYLPYPAKEWEIDENYWKFLNFKTDPLYQPYATPVSFALHTGVKYEGSEWLVPSSTMEPIGGMSDVAAASTISPPDPSLEDADFSETMRYISQILMEENFEQKPSMFYDPLSLQVTEKSFYDALQKDHPHSPNQHPLDIHQNLDSTDDNYCCGSSIDCVNDSSSTSKFQGANKPSSPDAPSSGYYASQLNFQPISEKSSQPPSAYTCISDGSSDVNSSFTKILAQNIFTDAESVSQFKRGLEEASKFLPRGFQLVTGLESNNALPESKGEAKKTGGNIMENSHGLKGRKNHEREASDAEDGRSNKQSAVYVDESDISEMFDKVLLSVENVPLCEEHHKWLQNGTDFAKEPSEQPKSFTGGKTRGRRRGKKKETVDLRTLMALCAQAVSANDRRTANELLKQIRQHCSPLGDASQRLAHYFANGLEARLSGCGTGTQIFYNSLSSKRISAANILRAYSVLISVCPFRKFAYFFANKMIMKAAEKAETLHIVDFGIQYGFQWPILIKFLSQRAGGPPKLRITGIELPRAGFRPAELIEETGRRLSNYCERFNVPFEYTAIASQNWETIPLKDFKIERNELLAVNCLMRFKNLLDETMEVKSPRDAVLNLIRKMNPDIFVQSIVNGSYNAPFFATRFKEALFHFSAMYDMFDTVIPRENEWRLMLEREFLGREVMNVVACEGIERVERPEAYKHWQVRSTRAGFRQLPMPKEIMVKFSEKLKAWYHRDFVIDEDNNWMLQGWKGRIMYASTCWVPS
ncbi:scarecrow-like protein 33 [Prosopis cineraria]|uniref:scarecrow-like protein 33 n=1 Tax=Prosopis cineraria TaxID=364024 RepID=UPI00240F58E2|nr:scarecrow-like protein 33 [Prosopis cineraria]XP_054814018.1 scarecrow-like protein 33 [Prosopis cineraria]